MELRKDLLLFPRVEGGLNHTACRAGRRRKAAGGIEGVLRGRGRGDTGRLSRGQGLAAELWAKTRPRSTKGTQLPSFPALRLPQPPQPSSSALPQPFSPSLSKPLLPIFEVSISFLRFFGDSIFAYRFVYRVAKGMDATCPASAASSPAPAQQVGGPPWKPATHRGGPAPPPGPRTEPRGMWALQPGWQQMALRGP